MCSKIAASAISMLIILKNDPSFINNKHCSRLTRPSRPALTTLPARPAYYLLIKYTKMYIIPKYVLTFYWSTPKRTTQIGFTYICVYVTRYPRLRFPEYFSTNRLNKLKLILITSKYFWSQYTVFSYKVIFFEYTRRIYLLLRFCNGGGHRLSVMAVLISIKV